MAVNIFDDNFLLVNLNDKLLTFSDIDSTVTELRTQAKNLKGTESETRILEHRLSFAEYQYGDRTIESYCEREGNTVDNWNVDIIILYNTCDSLGKLFFDLADHMDKNVSKENALKNAIHYYEKSLFLLEPWRLQLDSEENERVDMIDEAQIDEILQFLSKAHNSLGECEIMRHDFDRADMYFDTAILNAKTKIALLLCVLAMKGQNLHIYLKLGEPKVVLQELYDLMVESFPEGHPYILMATNHLIKVLLCTGEFADDADGDKYVCIYIYIY
jgi:hypothetical protein